MNFLKRFFSFAGSLQVTCVLLIALFTLVFWGTLFEARAGVEYGVERFFDSWFLDVAGVVPVPALKSLAVLLGVNLFCACLFRIPRKVKNMGLYLIHIALLVIIFGSLAESHYRFSSEVFALVGENIPIEKKRVVLDSADNLSFVLISADSVHAEVNVYEGKRERSFWIAPNSPLNVSFYSVYFESLEPLSSYGIESRDADVVRFWVKRDPFAFIPYLFSAMLFVGFVLHLGIRLWLKSSVSHSAPVETYRPSGDKPR